MNWKQSLIHAVEWRILAVIIDFLVIFAMTGKVVLSIAASSVSALIKTFAHAAWVKIKFRKMHGEVYK